MTPDVLPGSKRLVRVLDRWLNDCLEMMKDSSSFGTAFMQVYHGAAVFSIRVY